MEISECSRSVHALQPVCFSSPKWDLYVLQIYFLKDTPKLMSCTSIRFLNAGSNSKLVNKFPVFKTKRRYKWIWLRGNKHSNCRYIIPTRSKHPSIDFRSVLFLIPKHTSQLGKRSVAISVNCPEVFIRILNESFITSLKLTFRSREKQYRSRT